MLSQEDNNRKSSYHWLYFKNNLKLDSSFIMLHTQVQWQGLLSPRDWRTQATAGT